MKRKAILLLVFLCFCAFAKAQISTQDYRIDSLQFKMYTRIYVGPQLQVDSITVRKIFCDWCSESQIDILHQEAMRQSMIERYNPKYRKPGQHRLALYVRFSKEDFKNLNSTDGY
ncbi:hypothetical protein [Dokdonia sp. Hel_I_53]|uniref:hypothetical protein n=1 Tax=Dokdonia sp. Hel_I_53 TaxID=1566287 RepID=UPI0011996BE9|nr:hypothetical protein [Dokdonia sp. Hel_I_53]TVZ51098.1 hypothetical protein OD90_0234 [Dokdonia sp. Hel_I_53]